MAATLKVKTEELQRVATEYNTISGQVGQISTDMLSLIKGLKAIWSGQACEEFINKALGLENDMIQVKTMIQTHERELSEISNIMIGAENTVISRGAANRTNVLS